jgi:hypothetical protein
LLAESAARAAAAALIVVVPISKPMAATLPSEDERRVAAV